MMAGHVKTFNPLLNLKSPAEYRLTWDGRGLRNSALSSGSGLEIGGGTAGELLTSADADGAIVNDDVLFGNMAGGVYSAGADDEDVVVSDYYAGDSKGSGDSGDSSVAPLPQNDTGVTRVFELLQGIFDPARFAGAVVKNAIRDGLPFLPLLAAAQPPPMISATAGYAAGRVATKGFTRFAGSVRSPTGVHFRDGEVSSDGITSRERVDIVRSLAELYEYISSWQEMDFELVKDDNPDEGETFRLRIDVLALKVGRLRPIIASFLILAMDKMELPDDLKNRLGALLWGKSNGEYTRFENVEMRHNPRDIEILEEKARQAEDILEKVKSSGIGAHLIPVADDEFRRSRGPAARMVRRAIGNSMAFFEGHNFTNFNRYLRRARIFVPLGKVKEAFAEGFNNALILPPYRVQRELSIAHYKIALADDYRNSSVICLSCLDTVLTPEAAKKRERAYLMLFSIEEDVYAETRDLTAWQTEALFRGNGWDGMTLQEYYLMQRYVLEMRLARTKNMMDREEESLLKGTNAGFVLASRTSSGRYIDAGFGFDLRFYIRVEERTAGQKRYRVKGEGSRPVRIIPIEFFK